MELLMLRSPLYRKLEELLLIEFVTKEYLKKIKGKKEAFEYSILYRDKKIPMTRIRVMDQSKRKDIPVEERMVMQKESVLKNALVSLTDGEIQTQLNRIFELFPEDRDIKKLADEEKRKQLALIQNKPIVIPKLSENKNAEEK